MKHPVVRSYDVAVILTTVMLIDILLYIREVILCSDTVVVEYTVLACIIHPVIRHK